MTLTYGSLFSGIGGFDLGFDQAGFRCAWHVEKDETCHKVLRKHWPDIPLFTDVKEFNVTTCPIRPDVIVGGFPCQDISLAGRRAGLDGERSGLWWEFHRVLSEQRPRWLCIENVAGLLSSNKGADLGAILYALGKLGYWYAYRVLDSQWFGVPQRRRRIFIVGHLGEADRPILCERGRVRHLPAEVLFERESLPWDSPPRRKTREETARCPATGTNGSRYDREQETFVAGTLNSGGNNGGFRSKPGQHIVAHSLTAGGHDASEDGTGRGTPLVTCAITGNPYGDHESRESLLVPTAFSSKDHGADAASDIAPTLRAMGFDKSHLNGGCQVAIAFQERGREGGPNIEHQNDLAYALTAPKGGGRHQEMNIVDPIPLQEVGKRTGVSTDVTQNGIGIGKENDPMFTLQASAQHGIGHNSAIRRLTPRECERLQGFPDDWTRYGDDGKEISDSARYRMLGNAVTRQAALWIARRMAAVDATLNS